MPLQEILDPQGKAVELGLKNLGLAQLQGVRIGKHISLHIEAQDQQQAQQLVEEACQKLLANLIMESYKFKLFPA
jgi:phosphoribosylformylglycinamidine synthase